MDNDKTITRLQREIMQEQAKRIVLDRQVKSLQSKAATQRNEIARLTQKLEAVTEQKARLLADIKWMRGEPQ